MTTMTTTINDNDEDDDDDEAERKNEMRKKLSMDRAECESAFLVFCVNRMMNKFYDAKAT